MAAIDKILIRMRQNPRNVRFDDLVKVCDHFFGPPRQVGSHHVYRTPWPGDPRVNIQKDQSGKAKSYQVRQVLAAIDRLHAEDEDRP